jgi:hypothetical protein
MHNTSFGTEILFSLLKSNDIHIALCMIIPGTMAAKNLAESTMSLL